MILILRIITLHKALINLADKNWRAIEDAYNAGSKNSIATMRIEFEHGGDTNDLLQFNSYLLAREYYAHKYKLWHTVTVDTGIFHRRLIGQVQFEGLSKKEKQKGFILIPDQFIDGLQDFRKKWDALEAAIQQFTAEFRDEHAFEELRKLFISHEQLLVRNNITSSIIESAHHQAQETFASQPNNNQIELEFDWDDLIRLKAQLSDAVCTSTQRYVLNKQTHKHEKVPEDPIKQAKRLAAFFVTHLKMPEVVTLFKDTLSPLLLLNTERSKLTSHWSEQSIWGQPKTTHAETFKDTLTTIRTRSP